MIHDFDVVNAASLWENLGSPQRPFQEPNLVPSMKLDL